MKKIIYIVLICLIFASCKKTEIVESTKPVLIKVEAMHTTGQIITSEVVFVK